MFAPLMEADNMEALQAHGVETAKRIVHRVTHDFNNLIAVVRGYAAVLQGQVELDEDSQQLAGFIEQAGSELASLTGRWARFADSGPHDQIRLNLNRIVEQFVSQNGGTIPEGIQVRVDLGNPMPDLIGDETRVWEVCRNLWQNAIEAMPQGGRLSYQTSTLEVGDPNWSQGAEVQSRYVRLLVTDTGDGMDADTRANLFAPFFTTKTGKGRGLGATFIYDTVKTHGGYIDVSSELGLGTRIELCFPAAEDVTDQPGAHTGPTEPAGGPTLLVVDDDDMVRLAIQRMLDHLGYQSLVADSGEEALAVYEQSGADVAAVILDITMPGLGGVKTFRRLREMDSQVKIIVSSGDPLNPEIRDIEAQAISFMLAKPFNADQLARAIQQTLG